MAVSDGTIVVGAYGDDDKSDWSGAAYIFEKNDSNVWEEVIKITASDGANGERFGHAVSVSGGVVVIDALYDLGTANRGNAYVFKKNDSNIWEEVAKLTPSGTKYTNHFTPSVAVSGNTIVLGSVGDEDYGDHSGAVYIF